MAEGRFRGLGLRSGDTDVHYYKRHVHLISPQKVPQYIIDVEVVPEMRQSPIQVCGTRSTDLIQGQKLVRPLNEWNWNDQGKMHFDSKFFENLVEIGRRSFIALWRFAVNYDEITETAYSIKLCIQRDVITIIITHTKYSKRNGRIIICEINRQNGECDGSIVQFVPYLIKFYRHCSLLSCQDEDF
ncbi:hypothetical protein APICC_02489 [Apis cerana cerana]|uniref:Uncharacterized protein n=1 Tax=Apis cerana cerana TaxID=94128 RepID=A0A2A3EHN4_APICC|nr:hypothetical protein APICC_02489 [Apis cerana cerana]